MNITKLTQWNLAQKSNKCCIFLLASYNWQYSSMSIAKPVALATDIMNISKLKQSISDPKIKKCCTFLLASYNRQYSSMTITKPVAWQLTTGNNEHHQIKTIKSSPKIQKNVIFQKTKAKLLKYQIQMKLPNALALASGWNPQSLQVRERSLSSKSSCGFIPQLPSTVWRRKRRAGSPL